MSRHAFASKGRVYFALEGKTYKFVSDFEREVLGGGCLGCVFRSPVGAHFYCQLTLPGVRAKSSNFVSCMGGIFIEVQESIL